MPFLPPVTVFVFVYIFIYFGWRWVLVSAKASLWSAVIGATLQLGRVSFSWGSFSWSRGQALGCVGFSSCSPPALEHRLSCPSAHGIVPEQGSNPPPLHWQAFLSSVPSGKSVSVSTRQQSESALRVHMSPYFWVSFTSPQATEESPTLCGRFVLLVCFTHEC